MSRFTHIHLLTILGALLALTVSVQAQAAIEVATPEATSNVGSQYQWQPFVKGFNSPVLITNAGDGSDRLFVVEQDGFIFAIKNGQYDGNDPFLDVSDLLSNDVFQGGYTERGLLGLAFDPHFKDSGLFFIDQTDKAGANIQIVRYHVKSSDPDHADASSRTVILTIPHPQYDHVAGMLAFGPDGDLYIGVGDGGSQGDNPGATGQDLTTLLGKLLRINVENTDSYSIPVDNPFVHTANARPEIWAYGLRNPWRFSFDRKTGDLYIADVGQATYEEVDFQKADDPGGENYGWYLFEASHPYKSKTPPPNMTYPIAEYEHLAGACAIMGGAVYRGSTLPDLQGTYIFGDYCTGRTWTLARDSSGQWQMQPFIDTNLTISGFGQDEQGELYLVSFKGSIFRLTHSG